MTADRLPQVLEVLNRPGEGVTRLRVEGQAEPLELAPGCRASLAPAWAGGGGYAPRPALLFVDWGESTAPAYEVPAGVYEALTPHFALTGTLEGHTLTKEALTLTVRGRAHTFKRPFLYSLARELDNPTAPRHLSLRRAHDGELMALVTVPADSPLCAVLDEWRGQP